MYIIFQCNSALKIILYIDNLLIKRERNNFALINSAQNILKMGKKQFIKVFIIFLCTFSASGIFAQKQVFEFFAHRGSRLEFDENTMDGWTMDFICARQSGASDHSIEGYNSRRGVGPIETYKGWGLDLGHREVMHTMAIHFDKGFELNGFGWVTNIWEAEMVHGS